MQIGGEIFLVMNPNKKSEVRSMSGAVKSYLKKEEDSFNFQRKQQYHELLGSNILIFFCGQNLPLNQLYI